MSEWKTIDSAPDQTAVLLFVKTPRGEMWCSVGAYYYSGWFHGTTEIHHATHWMPLPKPPVDTDSEIGV